ncbi:hypothetical protein [Psychrobacter glacincola]|uniref:hypothetical protein n=1 Tax=Psychrobacter glacincola TaxID=56810 RepID=UPI0039B00703
MSRELSTRANNVERLPSIPDNDTNLIFGEASVRYSKGRLLGFVTDEYIRAVRSQRKSIDGFFKALRELNSNDAKSLLYMKNSLDDNSHKNIAFDNDDYKNLLIEYLKDHPDPLQEYNDLIYYKIKNNLPEKYLDWFKKDLRCSLFLAFLVKKSIENDVYKGRDELLEEVVDYLRYDIEIFNSDYSQNLPHYRWDIMKSGERKTADILYIKSYYLKNRLDCDKNISWVKPTDNEQINWMYNYLDDKDRKYIILKGMFFPQTINEKYELILASLDVLSNVESPDIGTKDKKGFSLRNYTLYSMKKAWDGRKQYEANNFLNENSSVKVTKENQPKLKKLMKFSGFTANKVINHSIEQLYDELIVDKKND